MKVSKHTLFLLIINIIFLPLCGNEKIFSYFGFDNLNNIISFTLPAIYFLSFFRDMYLNKYKPKLDKLTILIILANLGVVISLLFSLSYKIYNFTNLINFGYLFMFIYSIYILDFDKNEIKKIIISILSVLVIVCLIGLIQYLFQIGLVTRGIDKYPGALGRINSTMRIATILDKYIVVNIIFLLHLIFKNTFIKNSQKIILYIILFISILALAFTYSRTGAIVFYLVSLVYLFMFIKNKMKSKFLLLSILTIMFYMIPGQNFIFSSLVNLANSKVNSVLEYANLSSLSFINNSITDLLTPNIKKLNENNNDIDNFDDRYSLDEIISIDNDQSVESRKVFSGVAKEVFLNYPINGIGIGSYNYVYDEQLFNKIIENSKYNLNNKILYPHNMYTHYAAETGTIGFITFFGLILFVGFIGFKRNRIISMLILGSILIFSLSESIFYIKELGVILMILFALTLKEHFFSEENKPINSNN